jgi:cation transport ATPase
MGSMESSSSTSGVFFLLPRFFDRVGLDILNQVPNAVAQPLLVALLSFSVAAAYLAFRGHRRPYSLGLTLASGIAMYVSIYTWMSAPLYFISLAGLVVAAIWGVFLARSPREATQSGLLGARPW